MEKPSKKILLEAYPIPEKRIRLKRVRVERKKTCFYHFNGLTH